MDISAMPREVAIQQHSDVPERLSDRFQVVSVDGQKQELSSQLCMRLGPRGECGVADSGEGSFDTPAIVQGRLAFRPGSLDEPCFELRIEY